MKVPITTVPEVVVQPCTFDVRWYQGSIETVVGPERGEFRFELTIHSL
jgi:hypothetical protein